MRTLLVKLKGKGAHLRQRQSRAVEVLEYVATSAARAALHRLAQAPKDNRSRQEARATLARLEMIDTWQKQK